MFNHLRGNWRLPLGIWESGRTGVILESGALQAKVPRGDQMSAVRKPSVFPHPHSREGEERARQSRGSPGTPKYQGTWLHPP